LPTLCVLLISTAKPFVNLSVFKLLFTLRHQRQINQTQHQDHCEVHQYQLRCLRLTQLNQLNDCVSLCIGKEVSAHIAQHQVDTVTGACLPETHTAFVIDDLRVLPNDLHRQQYQKK